MAKRGAVVAAAAFSIVMMFAQSANAAGMGGIQVHSLLGQPLRAEISVSATKEELGSMAARLAEPEQFSQTGLNYSSEHARLRLSLEKRTDGSVIVVRSVEPMNEPYLDLLIEVNWQAGRLMRGYTVLLDPPEVASQTLYQPTVVTPSVSSSSAVAQPKQPAQQPQQTQQTQQQAQQPAQQPQEPIQQQAEAQEQPRSQPRSIEQGGDFGYVVKKGDNLHRIAAAHQLSGVSLEQMLVTLYRNNPEAFIGGNMNRLRQGAVLRVNGASEAVSVSHDEAKQVVRTQVSAWNQYRRTLASYADGLGANSNASGRSASGTVSAKVDEKLSSAEEGRDRVRVSRSNQSQGAAGVSEEDVIAQNKRLQESKDRVAALEKIVSDLQTLLKMKEQGLQELQKNTDSPAGNDKQKVGRSGKPAASLDRHLPVGQRGGQVFSTIDAYRVTA